MANAEKNDGATVVIDDDFILTTCVDETSLWVRYVKKGWVLDSIASFHICNDRNYIIGSECKF